MSRDFNNVTITGHLTMDSELVQVGEAMLCKFRVAVNRNGNTDKADFISVNTWNKHAEALHPYLKKGKHVLVSGKLQIDEVENKESRDWFTCIRAEVVQFLGTKDTD